MSPQVDRAATRRGFRDVVYGVTKWRRTFGLLSALATGLVIALAVNAVTSGPAQAAGSTPSTAAKLAANLAYGGVSAPVPTLAWKSCGAPFLCATAAVPLDYANPTGAKTSVAMIKLPAANPKARMGSLFVTPGGPGGSGVDVVQAAADLLFTPSVLARFDVIGVDPRGVGRSNPIDCFKTAAEQDAFWTGVPAFPVGAAEEQAWTAKYTEYTSLCKQNAGAIASHMSTANFVRDLDLLRQAVHDTGFTYTGYSYGTYVGETYAAMFPLRVRAIVIDGVLDPTKWATGPVPVGKSVPFSTRLHSDEGAYSTLNAFLRLCASAGSTRCSLAAGGSPATKFSTLSARLLASPLQLTGSDGEPVTVTYADVISIVLSALYSSDYYSDLADLLQDLYTASAPVQTAAELTRLQARLGIGYADPPADSGFEGVACTDTLNPTDPGAWPVAARRADSWFPYFGRPWTYASQACATWPFADKARYLGPFTKRTAHPVLVIGTKYDPATRYQAAVDVSQLLPSARLLTNNGYGHTSIGSGSCVNTVMTNYLVSLKLPAVGAACRPDVQPFSSTALAASAARTEAPTAKTRRAEAARRAVTVAMLPRGGGARR